MSKINFNKFCLKSSLIFISILFSSFTAIAQQGVGQNLAQDMMALVGHLELSNIGSRDVDCKGTAFEVTNVNYVIDTDIRAAMVKLAAMENKNDLQEIEGMISVIKQIPLLSKDGKTVLQWQYEKAKQDNFTTYGKQGGCAALSSSFRSVAHQRKLAIKNFMKNR